MKTIIIVWLACGFYAWGTFRAHINYLNTTRWAVLRNTERDDVGFISFLCLSGPVGALLAVCWSNFNQHGWRLWRGYK